MSFITLPQSGSIIDLDSVAFVIRIQNKSGGRAIRIGLGHSELQIITPDDARRFLEELRKSKQVNVDNSSKVDSTEGDECSPTRGATASADTSAGRTRWDLNSKRALDQAHREPVIALCSSPMHSAFIRTQDETVPA